MNQNKKYEKKKIWNEAVKSVCNEIKMYDGVIPDKNVREYMAERIKKKFSYKYAK